MSEDQRNAGLAALQAGDLAGAIEKLTEANQADPSDYLAAMYLGAAYGKMERHDDAVRALTQAVTVQPVNAQARYNLGVALERAGWQPQAATAFEQALSLQPGYPQAESALRRVRPTPDVLPIPLPQTPPNTGLSSTAPGAAPYAGSPAPATGGLAYGSSASGRLPSNSQGLAPGAVSPNVQAPPPGQPLGLAQPGYQPPAVSSGPNGTRPGMPQLPPPSRAGAPHKMNKSMDPPNLGLGVLVAIGLAIVLGLAYGFGSVAIGYRIPYLTWGIAYVIGKAVVKASKDTGPVQAMSAVMGTIGAAGLGMYIMYISGGVVGIMWGAVVTLLACGLAYRTGSEG